MIPLLMAVAAIIGFVIQRPSLDAKSLNRTSTTPKTENPGSRNDTLPPPPCNVTHRHCLDCRLALIRNPLKETPCFSLAP